MKTFDRSRLSNTYWYNREFDASSKKKSIHIMIKSHTLTFVIENNEFSRRKHVLKRQFKVVREAIFWALVLVFDSKP